MGVWESGLIHRTANAAALNWARWFKSNRARQKVIPPCDKTERKAANRVIICGAFNRERYRELINPSVVVKGAATPITQMRRTRLWQVR